SVELGAEEILGEHSLWYKNVIQKQGASHFENNNKHDYYFRSNFLKRESAFVTDAEFNRALSFVDNIYNYSGAEIAVQQLALQESFSSDLLSIINAQIGNKFGADNNHIGAAS